MVMTSLWKTIYDYSDHPRKLVTLNSSNQQAPVLLLSRWWDAYRKQLGLKTSLRKSGRFVALQQIKNVALYLWLIVVISSNQSWYSNIWASLPAGAGYGQFEHKALTALIAKFKKRWTVREIDVWAVTAGDYLRQFICIIVCLSWAVSHCRDNTHTYKTQRDKNARELSWRTQQLTIADASAWCCCRSMQNTRRRS